MGYDFAVLGGLPALLGDGATVVSLADNAFGGSLTLTLTPTATSEGPRVP